MTKHSFLRAFLWLLTVSFLLTHCKKDIQLDNTDQNFPLRLILNKVGSKIEFKWDEVKTTDFINYTLVRSQNPILPGRTPGSSGGIAVFTSSDERITSFEDSPPLFEEKAYYKLYAEMDGRVMESQQEETTFSNLVITGTPQIDYYYRDSAWAVIYTTDNNSGLASLKVVDLNALRLDGSLELGLSPSIEQVGLTVYRRNGQAYLALWNSTIFRVYSMPELTLQYTKSNVGVGFSVDATDNGLFVCTQSSSVNAYSVRKQDDFTVLKSETRSNYFERRVVGLLDRDDLIAVEASPFLLRKFKVDPVTGVSSNLQTVNTNVNTAALASMSISADGERFIPGANDTRVYDRQLNLVFEIQVFNSQIFDSSISLDGNFVYTVEFDFFTGQRFIRKHSIATNSIESETEIQLVNVLKIADTPAGVFVMASPFNNSNVFTLQRVSL
jgi:hypothetical protein